MRLASKRLWQPEPSKFCETYDFYQFPDPMLFRTVLAKAIAKLPIHDFMALLRGGRVPLW